MEPAGDETLDALWDVVLTDWDSESAHRAFVDAALLLDALPLAARRYRLARSDDAKAARAERQLQVITAHALARLDASRSPTPDYKRVVTWIAAAISVVFVSCAILALIR